MAFEVVTFKDFFGENPRVEARSKKIVKASANAGAATLARSLGNLIGRPYSPATPSLVDRFKKAEYDRLLEIFTAEREAGLLNDKETSSKDVALHGVKMVVVAGLNFEKLAKNLARQYRVEPPTVSIVRVPNGPDATVLAGLDFNGSRFRDIHVRNQGWSGNDFHGITIYNSKDPEAFESSRILDRSFNPDVVVRLETYGGDLWQNPNYPEYTPVRLAMAHTRV